MKKSLLFLLIPFFISSCNYNGKLSKNVPNKNADLYKKADSFYFRYQLDSAYYYFTKALKYYNKRNDSLYVAKSYLSLAAIDYYKYNLKSAEYNAVQTLKYAPDNKPKLKISAINILAVSANAQQNYTESLRYYQQYRKLYTKLKDTLLKFIAYNNNLGNVYKEMKLFDKAIYHYNLVLESDSLKTKYPSKYARALDNKIWCEYQIDKNNKNILPGLTKAYLLRKQIKNKAGTVISALHLATYFYEKNKLKIAQNYANEAYDLSKKGNLSYNLLEAIDLSIKINPAKANRLYAVYKKTQDSLIQEERRFKDQAAKIRFESEENEKKLLISNNKLALKEKTNYWLKIVLTTSTLALVVFLFLYKKIDEKNKELDKQTQKLKEKNNYIELIHKEMHHRIKNNFNNVFIFIQDIKSKIKDTGLLEQLSKLEKRIISISKIHTLLKDKPIQSQINVKEYVDLIIDNFKKTTPDNVQINNQIDPDIKISFKRISSITLIINEFISNSLEHAFDKTPQGIINLTMQKKEANYELIMSDNGKGLVSDFDINKLTSDGLQLIIDLSLQLNGKIEIISKNGLTIKIIFPVQP